MDTPPVVVDTTDKVMRITINRPDARNALNANVTTALREAFAVAHRDDSLAAVVLTGAGDKAFCAGGDLGGLDFAAGEVAVHRTRAEFAELMEAMRLLRRPIIGRLNGHALAGGFGLALSCDILIASDQATLGATEIKVGLWPHMISTVITEHLGPKRAMDLMLTGRRLSAAEAMDLGLVNQVVPPAGLDAAVDDYVGQLASLSPLILSLGKESVGQTRTMRREDALPYLAGMLTLTGGTDDAREGVMAFMQKRQPNWTNR